jgi:hypothetical protein
MKTLEEKQAIFFANFLKQQIRGLGHDSVRLRVDDITFDGESHTKVCEKGALLRLQIEGKTEEDMVSVWKAFMALKEDKQNRLYIKVDVFSNYTFWKAI